MTLQAFIFAIGMTSYNCGVF